MTQEDKDLLLKDLCARLPYGIKILHEGWNYEWDDELSTVERVVGIDENFIYTKVIDPHNGEEYRDDKWPIDTFDDKLFLRPMSSMTEEEVVFDLEDKTTLKGLNVEVEYNPDTYRIQTAEYVTMNGENTNKYPPIDHCVMYKTIDWLNKHHYDYRGLIEKGLALEAPEGMYVYS